MPRLPHRAALLVVAALAVAACSQAETPTGPTADARTSTTAPAAPSTTAPPPETSTPEEQVTAAYLEAFDLYAQAGTDPGSPSHHLDDRFMDEALEAVKRNIHRLAQNQTAARFPSGLPSIQVEEVEVLEPETAHLTACIVDQGHKVRIETGEVTDELPTSRLTSAVLRNTGGRWRVSEHQTVQEWADAGGCAR